MSRFKRNEAFFQQSSGTVTGAGGGKVADTGKGLVGIKNAFKHARKTGIINLSSRDLSEIPEQTFCEEIEAPVPSEISYSFDARPDDDAKFWEIQPISTLDLSFNKLTQLPSSIANLGDLALINLRDNQLVELPVELFTYCTKLKIVDLSQNCLESIPSAISSLIDLREFYVSSNRLTEIPDSLCLCRGLKVFEAHSNRLRSLPLGFVNLSLLSKLIVHSNQLSSLIDNFSDLSMMTSLSLVDVHKNRISKLPIMTAMKALNILDVRENQLSALPVLPNDGTVVQVFLGYNRILKIDNGVSYCESIGSSYRNVVELHINNNSLTNIPSEFIALIRNIKVLEVSNNDISDIPYELGYLDTLTRLALEGNPIRSIRRSLLTQSTEELKKFLRTRGDAPHWSTDSKVLSTDVGSATYDSNLIVEDRVRNIQGDCLDLSGLSLEVLPEGLASRLLRSFSFDSDDLSCRVQEMNLSNNNFFQIPTALGAIQSLKVLDLSGNKLSRIDIDGIDYGSLQLPKIQMLNISSNGLSGSCLEAILHAVLQSNCPLSCLLAKQNNIDKFPRIILRFSSLREIDLSNNALENVQITDDYPANSIEILNLNNNKIRYIKGIHKLNKISCLSLDNNNIMDVPLEIGLLPALRSLTLNGNPQKLVRSHVLQQGNEAVISYLRNKVPDEWKQGSEVVSHAGRGEDVDYPNDSIGGGNEFPYIQEHGKNIESLALMQEIEELENQMASSSISSAMLFKLKKDVAMKRAKLIRLNREAKK